MKGTLKKNTHLLKFKLNGSENSLEVQWLRLYTPMQGAGVQSLVRKLISYATNKRVHITTTKDFTCHN